ncbi:RidA family protein [Actinomadura rupiterrae]|uniref:RidA family protein n=1 Tax=Actinomadura rupiterrae TaxID=559627 RepID=UPI0020A3784C|nr:RidA family protein [Actinomadura rupiterrae]MCP2343271.1 enamine deaminase RidA (YjgF/YER057c/UK114 family) [Actinomadura rupiterrae]
MSDHELRAGTGIRQIDPAALPAGPGYSHGISVEVPGRLVIVSGQVPIDADGALVGPGDLAAQTRQVFRNIQTVLADAGATWEHVVKLGYYLRDATGVGAVRDARAEFVPAHITPAATLVEVSRLVREDFLVEIDAMAVVPVR